MAHVLKDFFFIVDINSYELGHQNEKYSCFSLIPFFLQMMSLDKFVLENTMSIAMFHLGCNSCATIHIVCHLKNFKASIPVKAIALI